MELDDIIPKDSLRRIAKTYNFHPHRTIELFRTHAIRTNRFGLLGADPSRILSIAREAEYEAGRASLMGTNTEINQLTHKAERYFRWYQEILYYRIKDFANTREANEVNSEWCTKFQKYKENR
jgi:hypothetical protein